MGEPDEGVPIEARRRGPAPTRQTTPGRAGAQGGRGAAAGRGAGGRGANGPPGRGGRETPPGIPGAPPGAPSSGYGRPAGVVYAITSDGILHVLGLPSGEDIQKPARFLPANARWSNPIAVKTTLYASTSHACGSAPSGIWAIDLASPDKPVVSWQTKGGDIVGSPVFTTDGTLIAAVGPGTAGAGGFANAIVALDPATLKPTDWFTDPAIEFASSPLVLTHEGKDIVAVATADGRILLLDAHALGGANHATPLYSSPWLTEARSGFAPGALAAWQEAVPADASTPGAPGAARAVQPGTNWLLVPVAGPLASGAQWPLTKGAVTHGAVVALKVVDDGGRVALQPGWVSRDLASPVTPLIVHGVVFAVSSGKPADAAGASATEVAQHASPAVLYAMNGTDGAEFWNSGTTMSSFLPGDSFWSATGQVYVGTNDGNLYAFGFAMERH